MRRRMRRKWITFDWPCDLATFDRYTDLVRQLEDHDEGSAPYEAVLEAIRQLPGYPAEAERVPWPLRHFQFIPIRPKVLSLPNQPKPYRGVLNASGRRVTP
jgi:hypothetical protein